MIKKQNAIEKKRENRIIAIIAVIQFVLLLVLRDVFVINISKYTFIALLVVSISLLDIEHSIYLFVFLIPLYVGLPGNYITVIFLIKILLNQQFFGVKSSSALFAILGVISIYCGIFFNGSLTVVKLLFGPSVLIIVFLLSTKDTLNHRALCSFYSIGVAVLGVIMLISTLKVNSFSDLLSPHFRLGTKSVELATAEYMKTVIDPNYYGFFSIASLVCSFRYLVIKDEKEEGTMWIILSNLISVIIALVGLSRTYAVSLLLFMLFVFVSRKKEVNWTSVFFIILFVFMVLMVFRRPLMNVIKILGNRFNDETVAGGNGRINSIINNCGMWCSSFRSLLLGIGIFNCNVHCLPLQFLFGGGILSFSFLVCLAVSLCEQTTNNCCIIGYTKWWPGLIVFIYSLSVPIATMLNVFFPIVFVALTTRTLIKGTDNIRIKSICKYLK